MLLRHIFPCLLVLTTAQCGNVNFPANSSQPVAWNISVLPSFIHDVRKRVELFQPASEFEDDSIADWEEGLPRAMSASLKDYWLNDFDWFQFEDEINANFSHYALTVEAGLGYDHPVPLHFIHERSNNTDAIPILLIHGYPPTSLEWSKHFHVIVVDLPGYGFSPAPLAFAFDNLMRTLGYSRYGVMSTDQGWWSGMWMSYLVPDSLIGHYADFVSLQPTPADLERFSRDETTEHSAYFTVFAQTPRSIGEALGSTPLGLATYLFPNLRKVNGGYDITNRWMTYHTIMLLFEEAWTSIRSYKLTSSADSNNFGYTSVPTGVSRWSWKGGPEPEFDNFPMVLERHVNLTHLTDFAYGGHFPAETRPAEWLRDIRQFFGSL
ncbi:Alpha/Beta hydrolase protein [Plectosphaerella plurivora]|uniref:Alpha/Beta hydrolase protein n=1 Tax=Plectosphaerella plurivora TaxID=936078 RepID=A0A9P8VA10_9PEZI|nr:Alpha/Beta hydrolase protein [Plectosphaerella plurivora]